MERYIINIYASNTSYIKIMLSHFHVYKVIDLFVAWSDRTYSFSDYSRKLYVIRVNIYNVIK